MNRLAETPPAKTLLKFTILTLAIGSILSADGCRIHGCDECEEYDAGSTIPTPYCTKCKSGWAHIEPDYTHFQKLPVPILLPNPLNVTCFKCPE